MEYEKKCCCMENLLVEGSVLEMEQSEEIRREKLIEIYKNLFAIDINEENENLSFKKLGIDSLQVVTILVEIQEKIGCDLYDSDIDLMKLRTFNDLLVAVGQCI